MTAAPTVPDAAGLAEPISTALWIANAAPPEAAQLLSSPVKAFGGWLPAAAAAMGRLTSVGLHVAFPWPDTSASDARLPGESIEYHTLPIHRAPARAMGGNRRLQRRLQEIIAGSRPDIVHVWGTEMPHALPAVRACEAEGVAYVASIQGLVSLLANHYFGYLPMRQQISLDYRDALKPTSLAYLRRRLRKMGESEQALLKMTDNVIGRTTWDRACLHQIHPGLHYFHCDEVVRDEFWHGQWSIYEADPFSIFMSQGHVPYKGLHHALEALRLLRQDYPVTLRVAGSDPTGGKAAYGRYISGLLERYDLADRVDFLGPLDADAMAAELLRANAYICPSAIENSPNSLAEAMLLGVPCVASYVGGIPDMVRHQVDGLLYQADAPYMLAYFLEQIFTEPAMATELGLVARESARTRHEPATNTQRLLAIYGEIVQQANRR